MKMRSTEILQKLIRNRNKDLSLAYFAGEYNISLKTIRNDIKEINKFLDTIPIPRIKIKEDGILLFDEMFDVDLVQKYLYDMDLYEYKLSSRERQIYIIILLFKNDRYISMQHIADELYVSRITIISDIENIKSYLDKFKVKLTLDSGKGVILRCSYEDKLNILISIYREIIIDKKGFFQKIVSEKMDIQYEFTEIFVHMQEYSKENNIIFTKNIFNEIVLFLFVVFNNPHDCMEDDKKCVRNDKDIDSIIHYEGKKLNVKVTDIMLKCFRDYMIKNNLDTFVRSIDEIELYKVIIYFTSELERGLGVNLLNDNVLLDSLFCHVRNMKNWVDYEIEIPKKEKYPIDYDLIEMLVEKHSHILEKFLEYKLNLNMKKSIVIHICAALIKNRKYAQKIFTIVICSMNMATGNYLKAQIENYFNFNILGIYTLDSIGNILNESLGNVNFVISTEDIKVDGFKLIKVNSFLNMEDLNLIQREIYGTNIVFGNSIIEEEKKVLGYISQTIKQDDLKDRLFSQVKNIFYSYRKSFSDKIKNNPLFELLRREFITRSNSKIDWKTAIRISAAPLRNSGYITDEYVEKSIQVVEDYGACIVVSPNVALAHSQKKYGVIRDGLSLLVSNSDIIFPGNNLVNLLFCFSSRGDKEYLDILKFIIDIGRNRDMILYILSLENENEIYEGLSNVYLKMSSGF